MKTTITCDRCRKTIYGWNDPGVATGGYYETHPGSGWSKYANVGENIICDSCMWLDPRYVSDYGVRMSTTIITKVS